MTFAFQVLPGNGGNVRRLSAVIITDTVTVVMAAHSLARHVILPDSQAGRQESIDTHVLH